VYTFTVQRLRTAVGVVTFANDCVTEVKVCYPRLPYYFGSLLFCRTFSTKLTPFLIQLYFISKFSLQLMRKCYYVDEGYRGRWRFQQSVCNLRLWRTYTTTQVCYTTLCLQNISLIIFQSLSQKSANFNNFWAILCKTVRPMLPDRCLSVCLSETFVYCGQTVGWITMPLGMVVGLGPGNILLDGDPAPQKGVTTAPPPLFGPCLLWPNGWMDGSSCHLVRR